MRRFRVLVRRFRVLVRRFRVFVRRFRVLVRRFRVLVRKCMHSCAGFMCSSTGTSLRNNDAISLTHSCALPSYGTRKHTCKDVSIHKLQDTAPWQRCAATE